MTTINTPEGIRHFQLVQLKHRLKLEAAGMTCHGPSARSQAAEYFDCKSNKRKISDQVQEILPQIEALIENSLATKRYRGAGLYNCCKDFAPPTWTDFDGFEIQPCADYGDHIEPIVDESDTHLCCFWSVYGHLHEGGVECITDCYTEKQAYAIVELFIKEHGREIQVAGALRESRDAPKH